MPKNSVNKYFVDQYRRLHSDHKDYGKSSDKKVRMVLSLVDDLSAKSVLDYGCGKSSLMDGVRSRRPISVGRYDPAIDEFMEKPEGKFSLVVCTDVMEHIPEDDVSAVLDDIRGLSENAFFSISTRKAKATLPDGQNAHATVRDSEWWLGSIRKSFGSAFFLQGEKDLIYISTWMPARLSIVKFRLAVVLFKILKKIEKSRKK